MLNLDKIVNNKNEDEDCPFRMLIISQARLILYFI